MKKFTGIISSTHTDLHGDKMTLDMLNSFSSQVREHYLPINVNHDPRLPPVGRLTSVEVIQLPDGEYAAQGTEEIFEPTDDLESLTGDGREIPIEKEETQSFLAYYDRIFSDDSGQELVKELEEITDQQPRYTLKKAVDPISILLISAGIFVFGSIAQGFFTKVGEDAYLKLKGALIKYYKKKAKPDQLLDFRFSTKRKDNIFEVHLLLDNPTEESLNCLFDSGFKQIDELLNSVPLGLEKEIAEIVLDYKNRQLTLLYTVRKDSVPIKFNIKHKEDFD